MENRFDIAASTWDTKPDRMVMATKFANEIKRMTKGKGYKLAFEYGCGTGNVSFKLKDDFEKLSLADTSEGMLVEVQNKIKQSIDKKFKAFLIDLENDYLYEKYDVIYTLMTMHHVKNVEKVIEKFSQMLLPGGMLIIGDLEKEDGDFHKYPENQDIHYGFEKCFIDKVLNNNNLSIQHHSVFHKMERNHTGIVKHYNLFISVSVLTENGR